MGTKRMRTAPAAGDRETAYDDVVLPLVSERATVKKTGMLFPDDLPERAWEGIGTNLRELTNSSAWWLADWLIFGESAYGWRRYREAIERTGLDYQTLRNYAWVGRRFEQHRRREALSFAHHAEVTRMSVPEQDYWLRKAEQQKWSRNELRRSVRASLAEQRPSSAPPEGTTAEHQDLPRPVATADGESRRGARTLTIELSPRQLDHYAETAAAHGLPVDQWATRVLDAANRKSA